ncbi:MAG: threonine synthase [Planctomycetota bacterium]
MGIFGQSLVCVRCNERIEARAIRCAKCGDALAEVRLELQKIPELRAVFRERRLAREGPDRSGVWRYRELVHPSAPLEDIITRYEGQTGLYASERVRKFAGLDDLLLKHEGENPTGSFKDRGMTVGVTQALLEGAKMLACASTGNTSASLASYAATAGVPAVVFIPEGKISTGKLAQTLAYGAKVLQVKGSFDDAMRLVDEAAQKLGLGLLNSINPWRVEGQKAIALEILDELDWRAPDWIILPAGNLGNVSAIGKGLREALQAGLIDKMPRLAVVQAKGASPFARWFDARKADKAARFVDEPNPETIATAIRIGAPRSWEKAIRELDASNGIAIALSDEDLMAAKKEIDRAGIGCEPASAASVAGAKVLAKEGVLSGRVVAVLTGHVLKDPENAVKGAEEPIVVDATIDAIAKALGR